jgi:uncharacterized protein (DUF433 family)
MSETINYVAVDGDGVIRVGKTRVMLESVIAAFRLGHSPETIRAQYPSLTLEEVYGAVTWCLAHPVEVEEYLHKQDQVWKQERARGEQSAVAVVDRLRAVRAATVEAR